MFWFIIYLVSIAFQCGWLLLIGWGWRKAALTHYEPPQKPIFISVIICLHNEEKNVPALLTSIFSQGYPYFEVIAVDDRSTDATTSLLTAYRESEPRLRLVTIESLPAGWTGKKNAVAVGISAACYEYLVFTDADCRMPTSWLCSYASAFAEGKNVVMGCSPYRCRPGLLNSFIRYEASLTALQYIGLAAMGIPYMAVGRNLGYTRSFYASAGGFTEHAATLSGDDDILINRHANPRQLAILVSPESQVTSNPKESLYELLHQRARHVGASRHYSFKTQLILALETITLWVCYLTPILLYTVVYGRTLLSWIFIPLLVLLLLKVTLQAVQRPHFGKPIPVLLITLLDPALLAFRALSVVYMLLGPRRWH